MTKDDNNTTDQAALTQAENERKNSNQPDTTNHNVTPTPTTEEHKAPEDNELNDNEKKAERQLKELERTNSEHITDDFHTADKIQEQLEYEKGQKEARSAETNDQVAHGEQVTQQQHDKREN